MMRRCITPPVFFAIHLSLSCATSRRNVDLITRPLNIDVANETDLSVNVMFWWWRRSEREAGIDMANPPRKSQYLRLERWEYSDDPSATHPDQIDIVVTSTADTGPRTGKIRIMLSGRYQDY